MKKTKNTKITAEVSDENRAAIAQFLHDLYAIRQERKKILKMPRSEVGDVRDYMNKAFAWFAKKYGVTKEDASSCAFELYNPRDIAEFIESHL